MGGLVGKLGEISRELISGTHEVASSIVDVLVLCVLDTPKF